MGGTEEYKLNFVYQTDRQTYIHTNFSALVPNEVVQDAVFLQAQIAILVNGIDVMLRKIDKGRMS